jgi:hypothetical protein
METLAVDSSTTVDVSGRPGRRAGLAGVSALVFLVLIAAQNVLKGSLGPTNTASTDDLSQLTHARAWSVHLLVITYVLGFPALLAFGSGLKAWCASTQPRTTNWAGLGELSTVVIAVLFGLVNIVQITMVAARDQLAAAPDLAHVLWTLHNAVFTINLVAVGTALIGLGRAAALARLVPSWMGTLTAIGGGLLIASAIPAVAVVQGSPWMAVGLVGFLIWMVFLAVAGIALLRRPTQVA